jgi:FtsZ-interacting cell division protein ZipA
MSITTKIIILVVTILVLGIWYIRKQFIEEEEKNKKRLAELYEEDYDDLDSGGLQYETEKNKSKTSPQKKKNYKL